ncbi:hypothetical protein [Magnetospirillum sp. UT-4]|uniref:hypothetical protein n=1 Tax=Magnetospirillum sp. UT-4 TaxID=2681467 RepID=UPI0013826816|nr:hypothetical protein [Magnetospirillum sp. UT-4]CAA7627018.1 hypothetical protein MTBUT4_90055 [Magnetospirillum sp. UT-4]
MEFVAFCQFFEDIRHEVGDTYSLIGLRGDALVVERFPAVLPKLAIQVVLKVPEAAIAAAVFVSISIPGGPPNMAVGSIEMGQIEAFLASVREDPGTEFARFTLMGMFRDFVIPEPGRIVVSVDAGAGPQRAGSLLIKAA